MLARGSCSQRKMSPTMSMILFGNDKIVKREKFNKDPERNIENQFRGWASAWEKRIFQRKLPSTNQSCFFYNELQHQQIHKLIDDYHLLSPEQVCKDRFAWTCFAGAIIKEHKRQSRHGQGCGYHWEECSMHACLNVLLLISYYLRLPVTDMVRDIVFEIVSCTQSLKFMFSYLPSLSLKMYMQLVWSSPGYSFEDKLCWEFFSLFDSDMIARPAFKEAFKLARPMLLFIIQHLSPLHNKDSYTSSATLAEIINKKLLLGRKVSLLMFSVRNHDPEMIQALLSRGASASIHYWDELTETSISAEKIMIASVNAFMGSQQFLASCSSKMTRFVNQTIDVISQYAPLFRRSVLRSELKKSSNVWRDEDSTYELNRQIADAWGIECKRPFPSLQHMCKIAIREQIFMADNMFFPLAAYQLPLPGKLIKYINLQLD